MFWYPPDITDELPNLKILFSYPPLIDDNLPSKLERNPPLIIENEPLTKWLFPIPTAFIPTAIFGGLTQCWLTLIIK